MKPTTLLATSIIALLSSLVAPAQPASPGKQKYQALCVGCHGEDGSGGGHGPGFLDVRRPRATSREAVRDLILKGIPDAGMPAFKIPEDQASAIAAHVMALKQPASEGAIGAAAAGDAAGGERFFNGKGNCASCHMVYGRGGFLGPDLSNLGRERRLAQIEQSLRDPGAPARGGREGRRTPYRAVTVRLGNGQTFRGLAKNESAFDLQLLSTDGTLHLFTKDQISEIVRERSLMPKVQASPDEMHGLIAYLCRLTAEPLAKSVPAKADLGGAVAFADLAHPKPGSWPTYDGNLSGNRFSPLNQINTTNIGRPRSQVDFPLSRSRASARSDPGRGRRRDVCDLGE